MRFVRYFLLLFALGIVPAYADLDQHCLSGCIAGGKSDYDCLQQCTYNNASKSAAIAPVTLNSLEVHRSFDTLMPIDSAAVLPPAPKKPPTPPKDPICVSNCLHEGLQYGYCAEQCVKTPCPVGVIICKKDQSPFMPNQSGK